MKYLDLLAEHGIDGAHPGGFALTKALLRRERIGPSTVVLDVGCGTGQTAAYLAGKYGCRVVAIDNNPKMLEKAKQRFLRNGLEIKAFQADAMFLPFLPNSFDLVMAESVTIFTMMSRSLKEYARVLKPTGVLIEIEMTAETPLVAEELKDMRKTYGINKVPTEEEWLELLKAAGFSDIHILRGKINPMQLLLGNRLGKDFSCHFHLLKRFHRKLGYRVYRCRKTVNRVDGESTRLHRSPASAARQTWQLL